MFPGFPNRVVKDLEMIFKRDVMKGKDYDSGIKIKVLDPFYRKHAVFIGGSILAGFSGLNSCYSMGFKVNAILLGSSACLSTDCSFCCNNDIFAKLEMNNGDTCPCKDTSSASASASASATPVSD